MSAYPNNYAVPGRMWPGEIWPGEPVTGGTALAYFSGPETLVYPPYHDQITEHTLTAVPQNAYYILPPPASLGLPAIPGDGLWTTEQN